MAKKYDVNEDTKGLYNIFNQYFINVEKRLVECVNYEDKIYVSNNYKCFSFDNRF